jgi:hypothetical protein
MWILPTTIVAGLVLGYALAWAHDLLARKAFEATLTDAEREQFDAYRRVLPWRNFANVVELDRMAIKSALDGISSLSRQLQTLRRTIRASGGFAPRPDRWD